jgi:hypothetical protein
MIIPNAINIPADQKVRIMFFRTSPCSPLHGFPGNHQYMMKGFTMKDDRTADRG